MIDLYFWTTPDAYKPLLFLEEADLSYRLMPINLNRGEQFAESFARVSPDHRVPAIVDSEPASGPWSVYLNEPSNPVSVFESGAILLYLAEKTGRFYPADSAGRAEVLQWLFWLKGGLGPMFGLKQHFSQYRPKKISSVADRHIEEIKRFFRVLDQLLRCRAYIAGDYSVADMACYPWINQYLLFDVGLHDFSNLKTWYTRIRQRPAVIRAYAAGGKIEKNTAITLSRQPLVQSSGAESKDSLTATYQHLSSHVE